MKLKFMPCLIALLTICAAAQASQEKNSKNEENEEPTPPETKLAQNDSASPRDDSPRTSTDPYGFDDAWFRLEGTFLTPWHGGSTQRRGDVGVRFTVDYEIPVQKHMTVSPRAIPFMFWDENNDGDNKIFAAGLGFSLRGYARKSEYRGFYGELNGMGIFQSDKFKDNSGWFNFMEEIGFGYVFKSDWSACAKVGHMSNANLFEHNQGVNFAGIGVGYSFRR